MSAVFFGSISTIADTSEYQRAAFNEAFQTHGLKWYWERDDYRDLLTSNGGRDRIADYAEARGESVDADAVHATKSELFRAKLAVSALTPRPGVVSTIEAVKAAGTTLALVTTTSADNVSALLASVGRHLPADCFDLVVDSSDVDAPKPDPAAYVFVLEKLGVAAGDCVAIEDNVGGVQSAVAAGVRCIAFPNENTAGHDFGAADEVVHHLAPEQLRPANA